MDEQQTPPEPVHQPGTSKGEEASRNKGEEPGRQDADAAGADRPASGSTGRYSTGVNPQEPIEPESPSVPTP
jgi:hypothetical protein